MLNEDEHEQHVVINVILVIHQIRIARVDSTFTTALKLLSVIYQDLVMWYYYRFVSGAEPSNM